MAETLLLGTAALGVGNGWPPALAFSLALFHGLWLFFGLLTRQNCPMPPSDILPSLIELSIAIAGFSGIAAAIQGRSERNPQVRIFLTSLLWSTFNSAAICVLSMVLLASPLDDDSAWAATSFSHAIVLLVVLIFRSMQKRRGVFTRTRALQLARGFLYALVPIQIANGVFLAKPWIAVAGLAFYSFFGFGFFVLLLLEIIQPSEA